MERLLTYINGNSYVHLYDDGTKIRETVDRSFDLKYPETVDVNVSNKCDKGCPYCYISATKRGSDGNISLLSKLNFRRGTEVALNLNSEIPDALTLESLLYMSCVVNVTVNSSHIAKHLSWIKQGQEFDVIKGVGVSVGEFDELGPELELKNVVYHAINGIHSADDLIEYLPHGSKLLILGFKSETGRGAKFSCGKFYTPEDVSNFYKHFSVVCFDNLAIEQIGVKDITPKDVWEMRYTGDDGAASMYIDLVTETFAESSTSKTVYPLGGYIEKIDPLAKMFSVIKNAKK